MRFALVGPETCMNILGPVRGGVFRGTDFELFKEKKKLSGVPNRI